MQPNPDLLLVDHDGKAVPIALILLASCGPSTDEPASTEPFRDELEGMAAEFDQAIEQNATDVETFEKRGGVHLALEDDAKAEADCKRALELEDANHLSGKAVSVADGDTLTILIDQKQVKVRVHGIDCPENGQPFGEKAKQLAADRAFGEPVLVKVVDTDRYGRTVGRVELPGGDDLSELLVQHGMAWHYARYAPDDEQLAALEAAARQGKVGL